MSCGHGGGKQALPAFCVTWPNCRSVPRASVSSSDSLSNSLLNTMPPTSGKKKNLALELNLQLTGKVLFHCPPNKFFG
jgi:hypothetical protein